MANSINDNNFAMYTPFIRGTDKDIINKQLEMEEKAKTASNSEVIDAKVIDAKVIDKK